MNIIIKKYIDEYYIYLIEDDEDDLILLQFYNCFLTKIYEDSNVYLYIHESVFIKHIKFSSLMATGFIFYYVILGYIPNLDMDEIKIENKIGLLLALYNNSFTSYFKPCFKECISEIIDMFIYI